MSVDSVGCGVMDSKICFSLSRGGLASAEAVEVIKMH